MESLQGPINHSCFFAEHLECIEEQGPTRLEEELEGDKMPFLQMLQSVETSASLFPVKDTSFQALLKLQHLKSNSFYYMNNNMSHDFMDFESCFVDYSHCLQLHDASPVKSEAQEQAPICPQAEEEECMKGTHLKGKPVERIKKRKRARPSKNKEEVETQRMTHIAVERNRRRQMNDHLNVLRSLMPDSYIQRGDQASIVGGAIDFVKELEQLLQSLEAQKRTPEESYSMSSSSNCSSTSSSSMSQFGLLGQLDHEDTKNSNNAGNSVWDEVRAENKSECADIEATVIQTHVNLKIQCPKRPGQLLKAIVALEDLGLSILHLNVTSSYEAALYSFNLQMEDECKLGSADEIAGAVNQIFRIINGSLNN